MSKLTDFGIDTNEAPPRIQKEHRVTARTGAETAGWVGPMPNRDVYGFARPAKRGSRANPEHWLFALDAYAMHDTVMDKLAHYGVQRVLVVETDTGTVLEWPIREYQHDLPKKYGEDGPQTYAYCDHATRWDDHADTVWIDEAVDVSTGYKKSTDWE